MDALARTSPDNEVRQWLDGYFDAIRTLDVERIAGHFARDIAAYDAIEKLEFRGAEAYTAHWKRCIDHCQSMMFEPRHPTVMTDGDLAVAHSLIRCGGIDLQGQEHVGWMRATIVARRQGGGWRIVHEHYSSPFDPMSGKVLDLVPEPKNGEWLTEAPASPAA